MRVTARGGAGKTRFAIELCRRLAAAGWAAGLWHGESTGLARLSLPRLVVIDYAEEAQAADLRNVLDALARHADGMAPVQVLMLARATADQAADALTGIEQDPGTPATLRLVLDQAEDNPVASRPLTLPQRETLYREAVARFLEAWCPDLAADGMPVVPDLRQDRYEAALDVLFEALDAALGLCGRDTGSQGSPAERVLAHEQKHWQVTAPAAYRSDPDLLRLCAALATLAGADTREEADALLSVPARLAGPEAAGVRHDLVRWLSSMYDGPAALNPVRPDRLGEELVRRVLADQDDGGQAILGAVLALRSDGQVERSLDLLARLTADPRIAEVAAAVLAAGHAELVTRRENQARGTSELPGRISMLASLARVHIAVLIESTVAALPLDAQVELSISSDRLGDLARDCGYSLHAQAIFEGALAIDRRKADAEPGNTTYRRDLSVSYERLADLAHHRGEGEEAGNLATKALELRRQLAHNEPGRLDLAEELAYALYLRAQIGTPPGADPDPAQETVTLLEPFEQLGHATSRARTLLAWARQAHEDPG